MVVNKTNISPMFLDMHEKQYQPNYVGNIQDNESGENIDPAFQAILTRDENEGGKQQHCIKPQTAFKHGKGSLIPDQQM